MNDAKQMYEGYWKTKTGLEDFKSYERNLVLDRFVKKGEKVLDLGAGEGAVSEFFQLSGCDVVAFDISNEALKKAKQRGIKTVQGDVEGKLPFKREEFDMVFWGDNVEHLFLPEKTLKEINRILKPDGRLILSTPNIGYFRYRFYFLVKGMLPQTEWYGKYPWQWEHIRFFNLNVMDQFLKNNGFKMSKFIGVSRRRLDKLFLKLNPSLFGMIMVVEAQKVK